MTDYYIRISDEKPLDYDESLYFKISADDGEFWAVRKNQYDNLVSQFNNFSQDFEGTVKNLVRDYFLNGGDIYANSIVNPNNSEEYFTYSDILSIKDKADANETAIASIRESRDENIVAKIDDALEFKRITTEELNNASDTGNFNDNIQIYTNKYFVVAYIEWEPSGIFAPYKCRIDGHDYFLRDVFNDSLPPSIRPTRNVTVMNGRLPKPNAYIPTIKTADGKDTGEYVREYKQYAYTAFAQDLKIIFDCNGRIHFVNMSDYWINKSGANEGYGVRVGAMWWKPDAIPSTTCPGELL